jgi:PAS domain S-box-containing protein
MGATQADEARGDSPSGEAPAVRRWGDDVSATAADARLVEATMFVDSIVENIPHMIFVKEAGELRFTRFNRAGEELLGRSRADLIGKNDFDFFPASQAQAFQAKDREVLRGGVVVDIPEEPILTPRGERWLHTKKVPLFGPDGSPAFLLGISEDITEQREMRAQLRRTHEELELRVVGRTAQLLVSNEELKSEIHDRKQAEAALRASEDQLRQAQKMDAVGRLAAGVAHDFNNLLSVIVGYAQLVAADLPEGSLQRTSVQEIHTAGLRAAQLTKQLLAFARRQVLSPRSVDLNEIIHDMSRMLERIIGEDVDLRLVPAQHLMLCRVDPHQVDQVLMNLVVNARDAMPSGGKLTVETQNVVLDDEFARAHHGVSTGPHVMLAVTDTGVGMDAAVQARAFEPFFTTKEASNGTGLGLSTVFGIVQQSGGTIWLYSEPGHGTTVKIYFPAVEEGDAPARPTPTRVTTRGDETVLLVEDDPQVRTLLQRVLEREGYTTLAAESATIALAIAAESSSPIHLLLTDLVLRDMGGPELAERVAKVRPGVKVLFTSGYSDSALLHRGPWKEGTPFLEKPVTGTSLAAKVRDVLDG